MSLTITVDLSDRAYDAIIKLSEALGIKVSQATDFMTKTMNTPIIPAAIPDISPAPAPIPDKPPFTVPTAAQQPVTPPPAPAAPVAAAPTYTLEQLSLAAMPLMDAGKLQALTDLAASFGIQSLAQLPKERYGEYATALRALGAKI